MSLFRAGGIGARLPYTCEYQAVARMNGKEHCVEIEDVAPAALGEVRDELTEVYRGAFSAPPYRESDADVQRFASEILPRHAARGGFRLCVAREQPAGRVVGIVYGYRGAPGQWWYDLVSAALGEAAAQRWMASYFELVTLAVAPSAQRRGIGSRLLDAVLDGQPYRTALLTTLQAETPAVRLYQRHGWQTLLTDFHFPGSGVPTLVMGRELPQGR